MSVVCMASNVTHKNRTQFDISVLCWEILDADSLEETKLTFGRYWCCGWHTLQFVLSIELDACGTIGVSYYNPSSKFSDDKLIALFEATKPRIYSFAYLVHLFCFLQFKPKNISLFHLHQKWLNVIQFHVSTAHPKQMLKSFYYLFF